MSISEEAWSFPNRGSIHTLSSVICLSCLCASARPQAPLTHCGRSNHSGCAGTAFGVYVVIVYMSRTTCPLVFALALAACTIHAAIRKPSTALAPPCNEVHLSVKLGFKFACSHCASYWPRLPPVSKASHRVRDARSLWAIPTCACAMAGRFDQQALQLGRMTLPTLARRTSKRHMTSSRSGTSYSLCSGKHWLPCQTGMPMSSSE